jgi:hypothetical protein
MPNHRAAKREDDVTRRKPNGISFEDRKLLLGYKAQRVTTHYAALVILTDRSTGRVCQLESFASPAVSVIRSHAEGLR